MYAEVSCFDEGCGFRVSLVCNTCIPTCYPHTFFSLSLHTHTRTHVHTANQETMVELVSFFQRSLPKELLSSERTKALATPTSSRDAECSDMNGRIEVGGMKS